MVHDVTAVDVAIIGGGHNGLTAACYLAAAGHSVVVLEKNARVGGAALTEEFLPGFRNSVASYTVSLLNPSVIADLDLYRHGLKIIERPAANFWPIDATRGVLLGYGTEARRRAIAEISPADADALPRYDADLECAANVLRKLVLETPPNAGDGIVAVLRALLMSRPFAVLPLAEKRLVTDLATRSADEFLASYFRSDIVKGMFAFDGIVGAYASPKSPGTAYVLLHHCFGSVNGKPGVWGHAVGGMGAITEAMAAVARERGVRIWTEAAVTSLVVENGRAVGVNLSGGETVRSRAVAVAIPPKLLFRDLVPEGAVSEDLRRRFLAISSGSGTFRMNVALSELPDFTCRPGTAQQLHYGAGIIIGASVEDLDRAYLDARTLGWSRAPIIEMLIPSTIDPTLAPPGQHVASLFVQHVAPHLPDGRSWSNPAEKEAFADVVIETVTRHAPNFGRSVIGRQVLSPLDLEHRFGLIDGDIFHGQLGPGQLFSLRPVLGHANYRLPVPGLYLCGSGAHPGGGVTGVPGRNAAREMIRDLKRRR